MAKGGTTTNGVRSKGPRGAPKVIAPGVGSPELKQVIKLYRRYSSNLGQFNMGAFDEAAEEGRIIALQLRNGQIIGYLLYRENRYLAAITHLCIRKDHRGTGYAGVLFRKLCEDLDPNCLGISVRSRRDYESNTIWAHLGFVAVHEKPGRGKQPNELDIWRFDLGGQDLVALAEKRTIESAPCLILDANTFIDLHEARDDGARETRELEAFISAGEFQLAVTPELLNEINRHPERSIRLKRRADVSRYPKIAASPEQVDTYQERLKSILGEPKNDRDHSDIRQLSYAAAAQQSYFITRDEPLLNKSEDILEETGVRVLRPSEAIEQIIQLQDESAFQPIRMKGIDLELKRPDSSLIRRLPDDFVASRRGEKKKDLQAAMRIALSEQGSNRCRVLMDRSGEVVALLHWEASNQTNTVTVKHLRVRGDSVASTVARYLVESLPDTLLVGNERDHAICLTDQFAPAPVVAALMESGFIQSGNCQVRFWLPNIGSSSELERTLSKMQGLPLEAVEAGNRLIASATQAALTQDPRLAAVAEKAIWPGRLLDTPVRNFIVPIRPAWASNLFDANLASEELFSKDAQLLLRHENVYYRAARPSSGLTAPGRILWYVTADTGQGVARYEIRACSSLDDVVILSGKSAFRKFARLGTYRWKDVVAACQPQTPEGKLMVLRFSNTMLFRTPVSRSDILAVLKRNEDFRFQSPLRICPMQFDQICERGGTQ